MVISSLILLRMRNVADKSCTENQNIHFMFNHFFFPKVHRREYNTAPTHCMLNNKTTDTHSEYIVRLFHRNCGFAGAPRCYVICTLPVLFIGRSFLVLDCLVYTAHFPHFLNSAPQYITFRSGPRNQESISCKVRRVPASPQ